MKYSFKEKQNHFQALRAAQHAVADLALLEQKAPALPQLRKFKLLPIRYADEILYALLDVCPREQIVSHRREVAAKLTPAPEPDPEATAETIASQALAESAAEEEAAAEQAIEAKQELEDLQSAHEDLQADHEDLESQMQELEETNEQLQEELEEEKKKEPAKAKAAPKPKKKSTPK